MEEYDKNCPNCFEQLKARDFSHTAATIEKVLGKVAIFAVLDGHGLNAKDCFHDSLVIAFALTLAEEIEAAQKSKDDKLEVLEAGNVDKSAILREACWNFPKKLHLAFRDDQKASKSPNPGGSTLSFIVINQDETITGVLGDSPTGAFKLDGSIDTVRMHENTKIRSWQHSPDVKLTGVGGGVVYYIGMPYVSGEIAMYESIGDFCFDADFQEAFWELQNNNPPKPEAEEDAEDGGEESEQSERPITRTIEELNEYLGSFSQFYEDRFKENHFNFKFSPSSAKPRPSYFFTRFPVIRSFDNQDIFCQYLCD